MLKIEGSALAVAQVFVVEDVQQHVQILVEEFAQQQVAVQHVEQVAQEHAQKAAITFVFLALGVV